jgi:hypothetical protein
MDANDALKELVDVKPGDDVADVASAKRINAIQTTLRWLVSGGNISTGPGMRKRTGTGWVTLTSAATGGGLGGGGEITYPFQIYVGGGDFDEEDGTSAPKISVRPGTIGGIVPNFYGPALDDDDIPKNTLHDSTKIYLQAFIVQDSENFNRYKVLSAEITFEASDHPELKMNWDDPVTQVAGNFWVHLGDIEVEYDVAGNTSIKLITQYVLSSFISLVFIGDDIVPVALMGIGS